MRHGHRSAQLAVMTLVACLLTPASSALASLVKYRAELKATNVVPPNGQSARGYLSMTYDTATRRLTWSGSHSGLSSKITGIHFHGPADPNDTAEVEQSIESLADGAATLSEAENDHLVAGTWYVDIHTRSNPRGEIRGQVTRGE